MTGVVTDFRDDDRPSPFPLAGEVIDLQVLGPRQHLVARFVGRQIGIAVVYVIAGFIWGYRGVAWAASRAASAALPGPKETP